MPIIPENKLNKMSIEDLTTLKDELQEIVTSRYQFLDDENSTESDYRIYQDYNKMLHRVGAVLGRKEILEEINKPKVKHDHDKRSRRAGAKIKREQGWN